MNKRGSEADLVGLAVSVGESHRHVISTFANRATDEQTWLSAAERANEDVAAFEERLLETEDRLRENDPGAIDQALAFLETDPWWFRSGYAKERLLRRLRPLTLNAEQERRSVQVVKSWVAGRPRREFRQLTRYARRFDEELHLWVVQQLRASDPVTRRHALWLLFALRNPVDSEEAANLVRHGLVEMCAGDPELWRRSDWLKGAVRQVWTAEWGEELLRRALDEDDLGLGELRLLGYARVLPLTVEQASRLRDAVLEDVRTESLDIPFENLAFWVPDDSLMQAAGALRQDSNAGVALRAWWVVRAIKLARGEVPVI